MNICIVTEYFPHSKDLDIKGGVEVCAFNEAQQLSKYNNVTVLTSNEDNDNDDFYIDDIHVICCGKKRGYVQKGSFTNRLNFMKDALDTGKKLDDIDLVIGYNFITYPIANKIAKKLKVPIVARYHDVWIGNCLMFFISIHYSPLCFVLMFVMKNI